MTGDELKQVLDGGVKPEDLVGIDFEGEGEAPRQEAGGRLSRNTASSSPARGPGGPPGA
jgi:hypothetical protein